MPRVCSSPSTFNCSNFEFVVTTLVWCWYVVCSSACSYWQRPGWGEGALIPTLFRPSYILHLQHTHLTYYILHLQHAIYLTSYTLKVLIIYMLSCHQPVSNKCTMAIELHKLPHSGAQLISYICILQHILYCALWGARNVRTFSQIRKLNLSNEHINVYPMFYYSSFRDISCKSRLNWHQHIWEFNFRLSKYCFVTQGQ